MTPFATLLDIASLLPQQAVDPKMAFSTCPPSHFLDCVQDMFLLLAQGWMQRAVGIARTIFLALAGLEIAVSGWVYWTRRGQTGEDMVGAIAVKLGVLAFILGALGSYSHWVPAIPHALGMTASEIGGQDVADLSVTALAARGWEIGIMHIARPSLTGTIFKDAVSATDSTSMLDLPVPYILTHLSTVVQAVVGRFIGNTLLLTVASILNLAVGVFVFFMFVRIAIWLLISMLESYIAIGAGIFFAGMLAFRGTAPMFTGYLRYLVFVAIKLFFLILIAGAALSIGTALSEMIASGQVPDAINFGADNASGLLKLGKARLGFSAAVAAIAFLLYSLAKVLPDRIARQVSGAISLDMKRFLSR